MSPVVRDLLIKGLMAGTAVKAAKKKSVGVAYYIAAGAIGCLGLVFLAIAGNALLMETFSTTVAAAITGSVILLLALCVGLAGYYSQNKRAVKKAATSDGGLIDTVEGTIKSLLSGFEEPVKDNPKMALLMAALAGFAAGDQLGERFH